MNFQTYALNTYFEHWKLWGKPRNEKFYHMNQCNLEREYKLYESWASDHSVSLVDMKVFENEYKTRLHNINLRIPLYRKRVEDAVLKNEIAEKMIAKLNSYGIEAKPIYYTVPDYPEFNYIRDLDFEASGELYESFKIQREPLSWDYMPYGPDGKIVRMISIPAFALYYFNDILEYAMNEAYRRDLCGYRNDYFMYIYFLIDRQFTGKFKSELRQNISEQRWNELEAYCTERIKNKIGMWNNVNSRRDEDCHKNVDFWWDIETTPEERFLLNVSHETKPGRRLRREMFYFHPMRHL